MPRAPRRPLRDIAGKLFRRLQSLSGVHLFRVIARPLYREPLDLGQLAHIEYRLMSEMELLAHCRDEALELSEGQVRLAFTRGEVCVGALHCGKLVGYEWHAFDAAPHRDGVWVTVCPEARYSYKKFVRPEYRGQRIGGVLSRYSDVHFLERGRKWSVGFVDLHNAASFRTAQRLGSRTVGYAGYFRFGDRFIPFRSPGAKRFGFRFYLPAAAISVGSPLAPWNVVPDPLREAPERGRPSVG